MPPADATATVRPDHPILVVDDEPIVLVALRDLLRQQGYTVVTASEALPAMKLLTEQTFAVVITDQQMPQLTGLEFLAEVKHRQPDSSRLLLTAVLNLNTVIDAINKAEIFRFVLKPWQRDELLQTVADAMARYTTIQRDRQTLRQLAAHNEALTGRLDELEWQLQRENSRAS